MTCYLFRRRPLISILVPYRNDGEHRDRVWHWLKRYWNYNLPNAEIIVGTDDGYPFSKARAINRAARKARGKVYVIMDADAYMRPGAIEECVEKILHANRHGRRLWMMAYDHLYRLNEGATLELLKTDPTHGYLASSPPDPTWIDGTAASSSYGHQFGAMIQVMPAEAFWHVRGFCEAFRGWGCVDEETEILTRGGWKNYQDVSVGDPVLTLNHETGMSEWNDVQKMNVYNEDGGFKMLSIESKTHSSLTTMEHRWPVIKRDQSRIWRTTETLNGHDRVPVSAPCADLPAAPVHDDALVELIAWLFTEGALRPSGRRGAFIRQSHVIHPEYCEQIESACIRMFGPAAESFPLRGQSRTVFPRRWYRRDSERDATFHFNPEAADALVAHAPGKIPSFEFLLSLTQHQLDLFIATAMKGDGADFMPRHGGNRQSKRMFEQRDPRATEAFAFAVLLSGVGVSVRKRGVNAKGDRSSGVPKVLDYAMTGALIRRRDRISIVNDGVHEIVNHYGPVWCPTTKNGTWMARRNGKVYFTGNSEDASMLRALDTLYAHHEVAHNDMLHFWHARPGHDWRTRRWVGQFGQANSRLAQRFAVATGEAGFMRALVDELADPKRPWRPFRN